MAFQFFRETKKHMMAGNGREFDTIEELKKYICDAAEGHSLGFDNNFDAPGYRWAIEDSYIDESGKWRFQIWESGEGRPHWLGWLKEDAKNV